MKTYKLVIFYQLIMAAFMKLYALQATIIVLLKEILLSESYRLPPPPSRSLTYDNNLEEYLTNFGYLPQSSLETGAMRTEQQFRDAVKNLQFFAGINVTGEVDTDTKELIKKPRCGVSDVTHMGYRNKRALEKDNLRVKRFTLQGERWSRKNLTWNLRLIGKSSSYNQNVENLDEGSVRRVLTHALDMWARRTELTFTELHPDDNTADIQVYFYRGYHNDGYPFDGNGNILAHAFFPGAGRGGDVHFDSDEAWILDETSYNEDYYQERNGDGYQIANSLFTVAVHEFGHSLGLAHSSIKGSIMFPWYSYAVSYDQPLPDDDLVAIQHLYGTKEYEFDTKHLSTSKIASSDDSHGKISTTVSPEIEKASTPVIPTEEFILNRCTARQFDAVAVIRGEMWIFTGKYFWRIGKGTSGNDIPEQPVESKSFWFGLPRSVLEDENLTIDAVYERSDHKIVFFIGREYYVLAGNTHLDEGPMQISQLGLPLSLEKVDAAFRWGWNNKIYFFSGSMYWRFDETVQHVELDYPRDMSMWGGIPSDIDSVFKSFDEKTYFFKGQRYWEFDDMRMEVVNASTHPTLESQSVNVRWLKCPPREVISNPFESENSVSVSSGSKSVDITSYCQFISIYSCCLLITAIIPKVTNYHSIINAKSCL